MTVNEGEFVSIIGPSGSGKSTLFNLIGGMMPPDNGVILLNGQPIINKKVLLVICLNRPLYSHGEQSYIT